jgi:hypothetical protein
MRIFLILVGLYLLLAPGFVASDVYYWTHVSARGPDSPSATAQTA